MVDPESRAVHFSHQGGTHCQELIQVLSYGISMPFGFRCNILHATRNETDFFQNE